MTNKKKKKKSVGLSNKDFFDLCERIVLGGDALLEMMWEEDDGSIPTDAQMEYEDIIAYNTENLLTVVSKKFGYRVPELTFDSKHGGFILEHDPLSDVVPELVIRQATFVHP